MYVLLFKINIENIWAKSLIEVNCAIELVLNGNKKRFCLIFRMVLKGNVFEIFVIGRKDVKQANLY
jgi:NADH:ubiquinone oxidoreductase subunit K